MQWIGVEGLRRYHEDGLAEAIACRWMVNVKAVYRQSGKLVEKYDVIRTDRRAEGANIRRRMASDGPTA